MAAVLRVLTRALLTCTAVGVIAGCTSSETGAPVGATTEAKGQANPEAIQFRPMLSETPRTSSRPSTTTSTANPPPGTEANLPDREGTTEYQLGPAPIDGSDVDSAKAVLDQNGAGWIVLLTFRSSGSDKFATMTGDNIGKQIAIVVGGVVVSAPTIQDRIAGGNVQISGRFSEKEAKELADLVLGR